MTAGSLAGVAGEIVKWRGFVRDTFRAYEIIANFFLDIIHKFPFINVTNQERDVFIISVILLSAAGRYLVVARKIILPDRKDPKGCLVVVDIVFLYFVPLLFTILLANAVIMLSLPLEQEIMSNTKMLVPGKFLYSLAAGTVPVLSSFFIFARTGTSFQQDAAEGLIGYSVVIVVSFVIVALAGAINAGFSTPIP